MSPLLNTHISPTGTVIHAGTWAARAELLEALTPARRAPDPLVDLTAACAHLGELAAAAKASRDAHLWAGMAEGTGTK